MLRIKRCILVTVLTVTSIFFANAQKAPEKNWSSAKILHEIKKLGQVGRVLYVAAHPDDENTQLISYLVNVKGLETAYISLTRGDGGQDLIGPEVREELGVIRTQELLMARAIDGGQQFFSRANDFGYSKTASETLHIWNKDEVLSDLVWAIRKFKPDIIITRFSPTYAKTHGHHQASAQLAMEAFAAAADPTRYPEQLKYVDTWQAHTLYWNTSTFFFADNKLDTSGLYHTSIGEYMPLLGKSVGELASESRSMHKSQGFGVAARRGDIMEYFVHLQGQKPNGKDVFDAIDTKWSRIKGCENITNEVDKIINGFNPQSPEKSIESLIKLYRSITAYSSNYLVASKLSQLKEVIIQCAGLYNEAISNKEFLPVGDTVRVDYNTIMQNNTDVKVSDAELYLDSSKLGTLTNGAVLGFNEQKTFKLTSSIPQSAHITGPYWLEEKPTVGMYRVDNQLLRGLPQNPYRLTLRVDYLIGTGKDTLSFSKVFPVFNRSVDPVKGELFSLAHIVPPAVANLQDRLLMFKDDGTKELDINLKSFSKGKAHVSVNMPQGWTATPQYYDTDMQGNESEQTLSFKLTPLKEAQTATIGIQIKVGDKVYDRSSEVINYDHIPKQLLLPKSEVKVVKLDIVTSNKLIGYIEGAGDEIPKMLKQIGYKVEIIRPELLATINLQKYDVIIAGVRAYNTVPRLKYDNVKLMDYMKQGGTYIVQYNTFSSFNSTLVTNNIGPYPLSLSADRTTEEDSKVTFLHPDNPVLNTPNKITEADFEGWVQERGLYYPNKWDSNYTPILEMGDSGEKPSQGALLVAQYGKGNFVYTGLSFFRELPAGVPGAYRLFANLIELGKHEK
jgi:LmbE family N-acetylglucosaminyl deacetylase